MRVLLIGASGQLGAEIASRWVHDDICAPSHESVSVEDRNAIADAVQSFRPNIVVNCAAFHNVDECERQPERALSINALAVDSLAEECEAHGATLLTISTDYVFDGEKGSPYTENDCPRPISAYGISKLTGEHLVARRRMRAFVVRTCGVYGLAPSRTKGYTFVSRIIAQAKAGEPVQVVDDVIASPTYAADLAVTLRQLIETEAYGVYHMVNEGAISWFEFAAEALRTAGIAPSIVAIKGSEWKVAARRPRYSALENARLRGLSLSMPSWADALHRYIRDAGLR